MDNIYLWIIAVFTAFFIKGICGFANTLIFSSIMSFGTNNINISPVDLLIGIPPNAILVWRNRAKIDPKICVPLSLLVAAGVIPGALFLKNTDVTVLKIIFGFVIIGIAIQIFVQTKLQSSNDSNSKSNPNKMLLIVLGLISGIMCGMFGIGAVLAAYVNSVAKDVDTFKANMCIVFLVDNIIRFIFYTIWGILNFESYKIALILFIPMLIGLLSGMFLSSKINEKTMKYVVVLMLLISGISLIFKSFLSL